MKTIYVVTSGEYSDYGIDAVFTDKSKAELFAEPYEDRIVEEYEADPEIPSYIEHGYKFYYVIMFRDGSLPTNKNTYSVHECPNDRLADPGYGVALNEPQFNKYEYPHFNTGKEWPYPDPDSAHAGEMVMDITVKAHDKKHAVKIANEKRTQLIALDRWPE
jgi:hypothetical protein